MTTSRDINSHYRLYPDPTALRGWREIFFQEHREVYPKGARIIEQGEYSNRLYYIISGLVEYIYTDIDGNENLIEVQGSGNIVGLQPFFQKAPATGSFSALTEVVLASLFENEVYAHFERDSSLAIELTVELCKIVSGLVRQLFSQTECANDRIIKLLCVLCETDISKKNEENRIVIGLSQKELARITRTTRVTVTKVFSELKRLECLETVYGGIIVKDYGKLAGMLGAANA